jgi:hypothetical protein
MLADLPSDVINEGRKVTEHLTERQIALQKQSRATKTSIRRKALLKVNCL